MSKAKNGGVLDNHILENVFCMADAGRTCCDRQDTFKISF